MLLRCCQQQRPLQRQQQKLLRQQLQHLRRGRKGSPAAAAAAADESGPATVACYQRRAWGRMQQQQGLLLAPQQQPQQQRFESSSNRSSKRHFVLQRAQLLLELPHLEGDKFIDRCTQAAAAIAWPPGMWGIVSSQVHAKGGQLYPLQLLQLLRLFAAKGFADEALLATVAARAGDFIGEASPPRTVELLSLTTRLGLAHPLVQQPLQQRLSEVLHKLQPHELPSVLCSLASLHAHAREAEPDSPNSSTRSSNSSKSSSKSSRRRAILLLDGLATQAELFSSSAKSPTTLLSSIEALSRLGFEHEPLFNLFTSLLDVGLQELTLKDLIVAATAAARMQLPAYAEALQDELLRRLPDACSSCEGLGRLLHLQYKYRLRSPPMLKECVSALDKLLGCTYTSNQLPRLALLLTLLDADDMTHVGALLLSPELTAALPGLPSSSICDFAQAAALCSFQLMRKPHEKARMKQQQQLLQQLQQQLGAAVGLLSAQQLRLSLQQREILKEVCFLLTRLPVAATAAAAAPAAALLSPPEGPLPIGTPDLDYSKLDLKPVLSRTLLVSSGDRKTALHHVGPREVYVHLGRQQQQQQQQQQRGTLQELLPGLQLLQQVPELIAAEAFSLACVASACSPEELQHEGPQLWKG